MMERIDLKDQLSRLSLDAKGLGNIAEAFTECKSTFQEGQIFLAWALYRLSDELQALTDQTEGGKKNG